MKKIITMFLLVFLFTGCSNEQMNKDYLASVKELKNFQMVKEEEIPCNIYFKIKQKDESNIEYTLTMNNPSDSLYDIEAVIIHDQVNIDAFPTIGYFDKKVNLVPNVENIKSRYLKEINLSGLIDYTGDIKDFNCNFKIKISYKDKEHNTHSYYYTKQY